MPRESLGFPSISRSCSQVQARPDIVGGDKSEKRRPVDEDGVSNDRGFALHNATTPGGIFCGRDATPIP